MKVTQVAIQPTERSDELGRPALTPELLAATGARYSRNNEGLGSIISKIDPNNLDKSVDSIFRMIDYGHQSIADMVPVAIFMDGISMWTANYLWSLSPTAGGQESSTRYLEMDEESLVDPSLLGIPPSSRDKWQADIQSAFLAYNNVRESWMRISEAHPHVVRLPKDILTPDEKKNERILKRVRRNYAFDRARYFLPIALSTNVMMIMSARSWVNLCQHLLSHFIPEAVQLGEALREELAISAPRLLKHATQTPSILNGIQDDFSEAVEFAKTKENWRAYEDNCGTFCTMTPANGLNATALKHALKHHDNRYAWIGSALRRSSVRFGWERITFGDLRDLNRHRTGNKYSTSVPRGFYGARDEVAKLSETLPKSTQLDELRKAVDTAYKTGTDLSKESFDLLSSARNDYMYWGLLGTQFDFEHVTTGDKFVYEAELRTGAGAHYRYARHLREALQMLYSDFPDLKEVIIEGSAEPE